MAALQAELREAPIEEDLGFFFRRLGELCFHAAADQAYDGPAASLAVASRCGALFFADSQGAWAARAWAPENTGLRRGNS